jgi:signal transduction histidine kinase
MKAILHGNRLPDDANVPQQILYIALTPLRLLKHRTAVNLTVSYVAMAVLTVSLMVLAIFSIIVWPRLGEWLNLEDVVVDVYLGEQSRSYGQWLNPDTLALTLQDDLDPLERGGLMRRMQMIVNAEVPGFDQPFNDSGTFRVNHVAILGLDGNVIISDDPTWASAGDTVSSFELPSTREVIARTLMLEGDNDPTWGTLYSLGVSMERTSASYPLITSEGEMIGVLVLEGNPIRQVLGVGTRGELLRYIGGQYRQVIWFITVPAILVAIPFGWWRSRSISKRLERLANAADAMAEGELTARSPVTKPDEIGRLAERFNEMAATIENNDRMRRAFISNVSHELRTPLSIIQGTVERQLERQETLTPDQREALQVLDRESDMLGRMIADLFTITRAGEQNLRLERRACDFAELAAEAVGGIAELAWSQSRVSIESLVPPDLPPVLIDPIRIRQVLNNLIYNALRHTPEGGLVVVQARPVGQMVEVSVSDTGRGIPGDEIGLVFERYYQAERGQRHDDGTGLGLSVVQQLVLAHGGDVSVESHPGEGTTFRFTLPEAP